VGPCGPLAQVNLTLFVRSPIPILFQLIWLKSYYAKKKEPFIRILN
jgi:hypothetical protein